MNRSFLILAIFAAVCVSMVSLSSNVLTNVDAQQQATRNRAGSATQAAAQAGRATFEYGTLTTVVTTTGNESQFVISWAAGDELVNVTSTNSREEVYRRLVNRLGGSPSRLSRLSTVLNHFGSDGWQLIETQRQGGTINRVFSRRSN